MAVTQYKPDESINTLAQRVGVDKEELRKLNPNLNRISQGEDIVVPDTYKENLPQTNEPTIPTRYPTTQTDEYGDILKTRSEKTVDPLKIQEEERQRIQAQIDALENYWSSTIMPELQEEATDRLGQSRGLQSAGGLLQSPRGVAMTQGTQKYNTRIQRAERAKIDTQIAGLYDKADQRAIDRADKEATLARQDQDAYFEYLKDNQASSRDDLVTLFAGGISPDELKERDPDRYKQLLENANIDEFMADSLYNQNAPREKQIEYEYAWKGNSLVAYGQDPSTGEVVTKNYSAEDLDLPVGVNPDFITDKATNMMYWYDKDNPETDEQGNLVMKPVKSPTGGSVMGQKPATPKAPVEDTDEEKQAIQTDIKAIMGGDRYLDTSKYREIRENVAINAPSLLSWFDKTYNPQNWLNPNDPTAKSYFLTGTKLAEQKDEL